MCILCVVQRWSRRVATMLPWLVIPLIILWALSQLLPPGLRFEITSPRLACVMVLLVTLFWYEILLPQLSIWRARRSARMREHRRIQAIELQKLRKMATRRCRNCYTPYRDQNPGGGRFMCSYCGQISKRPVLDIPGPVGSGIINDIVGKNGWICGQDWSPESNGNWVNSVPRYWVGGGDDRCSAEKSYSGLFLFACKLFSCFLFSARWLWRKVFRAGSSREDGPSDAEHKGFSSRKGENDGNFHESRGEKARRKAEEKRQARLEKEMLEEEERKQREEVARLVEERRKLRGEKMEAEKENSKGSAPRGERGSRKETDRRRQERRKEKDKGSNKSNSDGEELEKSTSRENERKREFEKKAEHERHDSHKTMSESYKSQASEPGHGNKVATSKTRYFDRMKGTFLSSSRGFNGGSFFGRNSQSLATSVTKASKPSIGFADHRESHGNTRDTHSTGHVMGRLSQNGDQLPAGSDVQPTKTVMKKSWHQLFTRSPTVSPCPDMNSPLEAGSALSTDRKVLPNYPADNQINFGWSLPSTVYPSANGSFSGDSVYHGVPESTCSPVKEPGQVSMLEEAELFEDPCYVPDPISLLGPVSKSLDSFPQDLGAGFVASADVKKPSPIESPMSRLRVSEERHASNLDDSSNENGQGTWQMWGTSLATDGLDLGGGSSTWFSPFGQNKPIQEFAINPLSYNPMQSQFTKDNHVLPAIPSSHNFSAGNHEIHDNGGTFSPLGHGLNSNNLFVQSIPFQPLPVIGESHFHPLIIDNIVRNEVTYGSSGQLAAGHPSELSHANCWSKCSKTSFNLGVRSWRTADVEAELSRERWNWDGFGSVPTSWKFHCYSQRVRGDWVMHGPLDAGNSNSARPHHVGGLFSTCPDAQSVWSFK